MHEDGYQCEIGSDIFRRVCVELNSTAVDGNANWSVEIMSGGVRFSDEIPASIESCGELRHAGRRDPLRQAKRNRPRPVRHGHLINATRQRRQSEACPVANQQRPVCRTRRNQNGNPNRCPCIRVRAEKQLRRS